MPSDRLTTLAACIAAAVCSYKVAQQLAVRDLMTTNQTSHEAVTPLNTCRKLQQYTKKLITTKSQVETELSTAKVPPLQIHTCTGKHGMHTPAFPPSVAAGDLLCLSRQCKVNYAIS